MDEEEKAQGDRSVRRARAPLNKLDRHALTAMLPLDVFAQRQQRALANLG